MFFFTEHFQAEMSFLLVMVMFLYFVMSGLAKTELTIITDQAALLQLKAHIPSDPHNFFAHNWSTSESPCNWVGITCGARHRRVTHLNLPPMSFGGTIPPHIGNLSFLVSLNLSMNNFQGNLPKELWQLRRLKIIDLGYNSLSGSLPGDICKTNFPELIWLDSNDMSGQLPPSLGECRKLRNLALTDNKFTGWIPQSLGNLTQLAKLYLNRNSLEGPVPPSIFNISSLELIVLDNNSLSGSLPADFCHSLPSLFGLSLFNNNFTGTIPKNMMNCTMLEFVDLGENHINGRIPQSIGYLNQLMELYLDSNYLEGEIPSEIGHLYNLQIFSVVSNSLTGLIPSTIFNMSSIETIELSRNQFTGHLPSTMGLNLPNLRDLLLAQNLLSGKIPVSVGNASELVQLELFGNFFSGLIPTTLGNCKHLQRLGLGQNNLTTESSTVGWSFISSLANCRYLRTLNIGDNPLKGKLPNSIGNLSTSLEIFYALSSELSGRIPEEIGNLTNMVSLGLFGNNLTGYIPAAVGKLQKLQGLDLSNNRLQGFIPPDLCQLERLNLIYLSKNGLQGAIPTCFANLTSLRYLYLDSNNLNSTIPSSFWSLRFILQVDLSFNSLSGSLPIDIGNLGVLTSINLARNQLSGNIPSNIGNLKDLTSLSLARNRFQGPIPQSFGGMISLKTLDLSRNNLSGVIPKSLEALSHLVYFNVSFNGLEGEIPSRGPFVNFSAESFKSNHALCGLPRLKFPPCRIGFRHQSKRTNTLKYILPTIISIIIVVALIIIFIRYKKRAKSQPTQDNLLDLARWRRISYHELQQLTNGFDESNLLGTGSFGSVYKGTLSDGMNVAIKVFNLELDGALKSFATECEVMRHIRHRNLVKIISNCSNTGFKAIILQYMPKGSLEKWLYSYNYFLDIPKRLDIMIDVASALEYLHFGHTTPVIHCDLKPNNILLDDDMVAHVGDFGIAKLLDATDSVKQTITLATIGYMAPEYGLEGKVSINGDVYSFGILLMETFTRKKPIDEIFVGEMSLKRWVEDSLPDVVTEVVDANLMSGEQDHLAAIKDCVSSIMDLALKCSVEMPEERMNMKEAAITLKKIKAKFLKDTEQV